MRFRPNTKTYIATITTTTNTTTKVTNIIVIIVILEHYLSIDTYLSSSLAI